jgi:hypothetical protein
MGGGEISAAVANLFGENNCKYLYLNSFNAAAGARRRRKAWYRPA